MRHPQRPPWDQKWLKMTIKVKKLKNHNLINNQGPFFGTEPWGRVSLEDKLLIVALGSPHKLFGTPKTPQRPPRGQKWLKMTIKVEKLKNHNRISNQGPFCGWFYSHAINKGVSRDVDRVAPMSVWDGMVRGTLADRKAKPPLEKKTDLLGGEAKWKMISWHEIWLQWNV